MCVLCSPCSALLRSTHINRTRLVHVQERQSSTVCWGFERQLMGSTRAKSHLFKRKKSEKMSGALK